MRQKKRLISPEKRKKDFRVAVFGSARIKTNDARYKEVSKLAQMLGERGIDIVTGGGPGLMRAASEGFKKGSNGKGHSIGLGIKLPKEQGFNKHLDVKEEFNIFSNRLDKFMVLSNAVVVAPGGVGTMLELFYAWQLVQVNHICHIPIILLGKQWGPFVKWLEKYPLKNGMISKKDLHLLFLADNCEEAMKVIDKAHEEWETGGEDFCLSYKKYRL